MVLRFINAFLVVSGYKGSGGSIIELEDILIKDMEEQKSYTGTGDIFNFKEPYRGISVETLKKYKVYHDQDGNVLFEYFDYDKNNLATKIKFRDGSFTIRHKVTKGFQSSGLFGAHLFSQGGKYVTLTEGEEDAMSVYEFQGRKYPCVSLKNGVNTKLTNEDKKFLESFEIIVYCGDNDEPGRKRF